MTHIPLSSGTGPIAGLSLLCCPKGKNRMVEHFAFNHCTNSYVVVHVLVFQVVLLVYPPGMLALVQYKTCSTLFKPPAQMPLRFLANKTN